MVAACEQKTFKEPECNIDDIHSLIALTQSSIKKVSALQLEKVDGFCKVTEDAGLKSVSMPLTQYVTMFALPNFYFHLTTVYYGLKLQNIEVSKGDFDNIHFYPAAFSWEQ